MTKRQRRITTTNKTQVVLDKSLVADLTEGEPDYFWVCLTPLHRWLILTLLEFFSDPIYRNRFHNWTDDREIEQTLADLFYELEVPLACQPDVAQISATLISMLAEQESASEDLSLRLIAINTTLQEIRDNIAAIPDNASLFDQLEPILNGVGVILGAPPITLP